jgi:hypothetical protein
MRVLILAAGLLPSEVWAEQRFNVTLDGAQYSARVVDDEPSGHLRRPVVVDEQGIAHEIRPELDAGPFLPAVRIGGTIEHDIDTAIRVLAAVCGFDYENVKDWGAYGDPVWRDVRTDEVVFWTDCQP